jgi:hypothetical protein
VASRVPYGLNLPQFITFFTATHSAKRRLQPNEKKETNHESH